MYSEKSVCMEGIKTSDSQHEEFFIHQEQNSLQKSWFLSVNSYYYSYREYTLQAACLPFWLLADLWWISRYSLEGQWCSSHTEAKWVEFWLGVLQEPLICILEFCNWQRAEYKCSKYIMPEIFYIHVSTWNGVEETLPFTKIKITLHTVSQPVWSKQMLSVLTLERYK